MLQGETHRNFVKSTVGCPLFCAFFALAVSLCEVFKSIVSPSIINPRVRVDARKVHQDDGSSEREKRVHSEKHTNINAQHLSCFSR